MGRDTRLGEFLQARRALLSPEAAGVPAYGRRRVPGLRREELAQLAGVSVDYYVRLEQGRAQHPSAEVLDALARALQLDDVERRHMHGLAAPAPADGAPVRAERARPGLRQLLDQLDGVPAFVMGRRMDVLVANPLGAALMGYPDGKLSGRPNIARMIFLDPEARTRYPEWERVAREAVGHLRACAGRHPDDPGIAALIGELSVKSEEFARWWAGHLVQQKAHGAKRYRHPAVGELTLAYETLSLPGEPDQLLVVYTAQAGSASATALRLLASWAAPPATERVTAR